MGRYQSQRLIFLINPLAGKGKSRMLVDRLMTKAETLGKRLLSLDEAEKQEGCLMKMHFEVHEERPRTIAVYRARSQDETISMTRHLSEKYGKKLILVSCGGDGTLGDVATGLYQSESGFLVIPFGSGNDFARTIYKKEYSTSEDILDSLGLGNESCGKTESGAWPELSEGRCDSILFETDSGQKRVCINVLNTGIDSKVAATASRFIRRFPGIGKLAYLAGIVPALAGRKIYRMDYKFKGIKWDNPEIPELLPEGYESELSGRMDYTIAAVCNGAYYGGGFQPDPYADISDGVLEAAVSKGLKVREIAGILGKYRNGEAQKTGALRMFSISEGMFSVPDEDEPILLTYDGENCSCRKVSFKVHKRGLRIFFPKSAVKEEVIRKMQPEDETAN